MRNKQDNSFMLTLESSKACIIIEEILSLGYKVCFTVSGKSMYPYIIEQDRVTVDSLVLNDLIPGDILLCKRGRYQFFIHRFIESTFVNGKKCIITAGDSLSTPDPPISIQEVLGKVICIERLSYLSRKKFQ